MSVPPLDERDFLTSLQNYLPQGRAWSRDPDSTLSKLLSGFAKAYARVHYRAQQLLIDAFPPTTQELLPEWEATLGLPDPCIGELPLLSERIAQVVARLTNPGGQSIPFFIDYAAKLGYTITIKEFRPSVFGRHFGDPFGGAAWAHHWEVTLPTAYHYFQFGNDSFGSRFADYGSVVVQCEFQRLKPGHTTVSFVSP